jgi:hypothetical protein
MITDQQNKILEAKRELARRELARRHLMPFVQYMFPGYEANWHHEVIADRLERLVLGAMEQGNYTNPQSISRLIISMPPRHGKSELASIHFPAWFLAKFPNKEVIATSYGADLATDFGRKVRNMFDKQDFKNVFPSVNLAADSKAANKWNTNQGGAYTAAGVGGAITGKGADLLIIDDPFKNSQEAMNEQVRQQKWEWLWDVAMTRLSQKGVVVLIMTRWHDDDFVGRLHGMPVDSVHPWHELKFPAIATKNEHEEIFSPRRNTMVHYHRTVGESLWPDRYSVQELEARRNGMSKYSWSALFQQDPVDEESIEFKKEWFKTRTEKDVQALNTRRFLTIDAAGSLTDRSDFIGVVDNRVDERGKWNLIARQYRMNSKELVDFIIAQYKLHAYEVIGIEKGIYTSAIKPFLDIEIMKQGLTGRINIVELSHQNISKPIRIRGLIPYYQSGKIYHIEGECDDLVPQLVRFPKGVKDDILDAEAYQLQVASQPFSFTDGDGTTVNEPETDRDFDPHSPIAKV